ncbi:helix-turn-helix domain-containing protein [Variovorax paradoxus]|uniref:helix-turn-helix domain-containing protein n=1 Tax=Variovorax paradoxus TaxID=34073 RepID=UPI003D6623D4
MPAMSAGQRLRVLRCLQRMRRSSGQATASGNCGGAGSEHSCGRRRHQGQQAAAARLPGISRAALYEKLSAGSEAGGA